MVALSTCEGKVTSFSFPLILKGGFNDHILFFIPFINKAAAKPAQSLCPVQGQCPLIGPTEDRLATRPGSHPESKSPDQ